MNTDKDITKFVGAKIKHYRKLRKMTQKELGLKIGVKHNTISGYESGTNEADQDMLFKIASILDVSINDLFPSIKNISPQNLIPINSGLIKIPVIGEIACGEPILASQNIEEFIYEPSDTLPNGEIFALKAKGDSMEPTIPNGAIVLIREQNEVAYGEIAAVLVNGDLEATLKRIKKQGDTVFLMSDNPKYEPYIIDEQNPARIIGKAISFKVTL
jgi:repressor LexA